MWPFTKSAESADLRFERYSDKVDALTRQVRALELEWESTYNKLRSLMARLNKRAEREDTPAAPATPGETLPGDALPTVAAAAGGRGAAVRIHRGNY